jgi:hypothetical protein
LNVSWWSYFAVFSKALSARYHTEIWHFDEAFVMDALSVIEAFFA